MSDNDKAKPEGDDPRDPPSPPTPVESQDAASDSGASGGQGPREGKRNGALAFLSDLETSEKITAFLAFCTLVVGVGSLVVAFLAYQTAADTKDIKSAISNLSALATQTKREADNTAKLIGPANRSADAAVSGVHQQSDQFRLDERPIIELTDCPSGQPGAAYDNTAAWNYCIRNYGKTAARNIHIFEYVSVFGSKPKGKDLPKGRFSPNMEPTIWNWSTATYSRPISRDVFDSALKVDDGIIAAIKIIYVDYSGRRFEKRICMARLKNGAPMACIFNEVMRLHGPAIGE